MEEVEDALGEVGRLVFGQVLDIVGVLEGLASIHRNLVVGVSSWHVEGKIEVTELVVKRSAVWIVRRLCAADGEDLVEAGPVEEKLGVERDDDGVLLKALTDG